MPSHSRRSVLVACAVIALSGCTGVFSDGNGAVRFCLATIQNFSDSSHDVDIQLLDDGDLVHEEHLEIASGAGQAVPDEAESNALPSDRGAFTFRSRADDGAWPELPLPDQDVDPVRVAVSIHGDLPSLTIEAVETMAC